MSGVTLIFIPSFSSLLELLLLTVLLPASQVAYCLSSLSWPCTVNSFECRSFGGAGSQALRGSIHGPLICSVSFPSILHPVPALCKQTQESLSGGHGPLCPEMIAAI